MGHLEKMGVGVRSYHTIQRTRTEGPQFAPNPGPALCVPHSGRVHRITVGTNLVDALRVTTSYAVIVRTGEHARLPPQGDRTALAALLGGEPDFQDGRTGRQAEALRPGH